MGGYLSNASTFLIDALLGIYIFLVLLRFLLQIVRADFYNPLCQAIVTLTNPALRPMRRYVPSLMGLDTAAVLLLLILQMGNIWFVGLLQNLTLPFFGILAVAIAEILNTTLWTFIGAIIIQVLLSWVAQGAYSPFISVVHSLTEPVLSPIRSAVPSLGGLDFSPFIAILLLNVIDMIAIQPIRDFGSKFF